MNQRDRNLMTRLTEQTSDKVITWWTLEGGSPRGDHWSHVSDHDSLEAVQKRYKNSRFQWNGRPMRILKHEVTILATNQLDASGATEQAGPGGASLQNAGSST